MGGNIKFTNRHMIVSEGGNVFKDIHSEPINKEDIRPTLKEFFRELSKIFPKASKHFGDVKTLGSVGKKSVSGDIDLALDENALKNLEDWNVDKTEVDNLYKTFKKKSRTATDAMIVKRAVIHLIAKQIEEKSNLINVDTKQAGQGTLFTQFPQFNSKGEKLDRYVQIDVNIGNVPWLLFSYYSDAYPEGSNVKGLHRTQLIVHLFTNKGYTFNHGNGVKIKSTGEVVANTPEEAIQVLNKAYRFNLDRETLNNYYKLQDYLKDHIQQDELNHIYDIYLKTLDSTRCDIPNDLQNYWLDNQQRLGLTGKFLPSSSKLYPFRNLD